MGIMESLQTTSTWPIVVVRLHSLRFVCLPLSNCRSVSFVGINSGNLTLSNAKFSNVSLGTSFIITDYYNYTDSINITNINLSEMDCFEYQACYFISTSGTDVPVLQITAFTLSNNIGRFYFVQSTGELASTVLFSNFRILFSSFSGPFMRFTPANQTILSNFQYQ